MVVRNFLPVPNHSAEFRQTTLRVFRVLRRSITSGRTLRVAVRAARQRRPRMGELQSRSVFSRVVDPNDYEHATAVFADTSLRPSCCWRAVKMGGAPRIAD